jgi:hypothetical protein
MGTAASLTLHAESVFDLPGAADSNGWERSVNRPQEDLLLLSEVATSFRWTLPEPAVWMRPTGGAGTQTSDE